MNTIAVGSSLLGVALIVCCTGAPLDSIVGVDLTPGNTSFWNQDFVIGGQQIEVGLGWQNDQIAVGAKVNLKDVIKNGKDIPISAAVSTNVNNWKDIVFQIGTNVDEKVSAQIAGDITGAVAYNVNARLPINKQGLSSIGASLNGGYSREGGVQNSLTAGVGLGKQVLQAEINLNNLNPTHAGVQIGANTK